jgi:bacterial/archaeal transporter family-2 protein
MNLLLLIGLTIVISIFSTAVVPLYARGGQLVGAYWAATLYLGAGAVVALLLLGMESAPVSLAAIQELPPYVYLNGFFNVLVVMAVVVLVPKIGVGTTWAATVVGQLAAAVAFDHIGFLGVSHRPVDLSKAIALVTVLVGLFLFARRQRGATPPAGGEEPGAGVAPRRSSVRQWAGVGVGIVVGASIILMHTINARSGQLLGVTGAVALYLGLGTLLSLFLCLLLRPRDLARVARLPLQYYLPGIVNVLTVGLPALVIPLMGVALYTAATFVAQAVANMAFDYYGVLGMPRSGISAARVAGALLLFCGVLLLQAARA